MADVPTFEIFLGPPGQDATWLESVEGLANAKERMQQLAAEKPGSYFIFFTATRSIVAQAITSESATSSENSAA